jgi:hypothetical protein
LVEYRNYNEFFCVFSAFFLENESGNEWRRAAGEGALKFSMENESGNEWWRAAGEGALKFSRCFGMLRINC